jgi:hypothetical protein
MRRIHQAILLAALPALAFLVLAGCGPKFKGGEGKGAPVAAGAGDGGGQATKSKALVGTAYTANVKGKVVWKGGDTGFLAKLTADLQKAIATNQNSAYCHMGPAEEQQQQEYVIGANGNVGNVFVWLEAPERGAYIQVPDDQVKAAAKEEKKLHQPYCAFEPHCLTLFPYSTDKDGKLKKTGQELLVLNDAKISHNSKITGGLKNGVQGGAIESGKSKEFVLYPEREPVTVACDIHGWMRSYLMVFNHPYATVSKASGKDDFGTFEIKNAPVGRKLRLVAYHEKEGYLGGREGREITLTAGDNAIPDIEMTRKGG